MPAPAAAIHTISTRRAYLSLSLGVFAIGWSALFVRWAGTTGTVSAFYRLAIAAVVFSSWRMVAKPDTSKQTREARRMAIVAGIFFGIDLALFNSAVMTTSAMNATLLGVNAPIFVAFGTWLMYGDRPSARFWMGFLLAFGGMVAIVGTDVVVHPSLGFGDMLAVGGALFYGLYLLYVQRSRVGMDSLTFSVWASAIGALTLLPVCLLTGQQITGLSAQAWWSLLGLALVPQVIGHWLVAHSMGRLPATSSSIVLLAQAPITALLAWPLLGERPRVGQVIGGALVLVGIMVVNVTRTRAVTISP